MKKGTEHAEPVISMRNIKKEFSGVKVLDGITFDVYAGEIHCLVGENGAGKSTLMKILSGVYEKDGGTVIFNGETIEKTTPIQALRRGLSIIYQEFNLVNKMTVGENIFLGRFGETKGMNGTHQRARALLDSIGSTIDTHTIVGDLSASEMQMVEITKALSFDSKLIIMDEPSSSLTAEELKKLGGIIKDLRSRGISIIYISHKLDEIFDYCDIVTIMRDGHVIDTKPIGELTRSEMIAKMVGRTIDNEYPLRASFVGEPLLEVKNLNTNKLHDISFTLHKGEILGVAGLDGSGRTELLETLFGYRTRQSGTIKKFNFGFRAAQGGTPEDYSMEVHDINGTQVGEEISNLSPNSAIKQGFALVTEERRATGIFGILDIRANTVIANLKNYKLGKFPLLSDAKMARDTDRMIEAMHIKTPSQRQQIKNLSGGNQQKVIFGRWMLTNPDVLLLDDPTRGIDVGAKYEIYELIQSLAKQGKSIIMVSSEMPELLGTCNRILVMSAGQIAGEYVPTGDGKVDQEKILELAAKNL